MSSTIFGAQRPVEITGPLEKVDTGKLCKEIFEEIEGTSIYSQCKKARKYESWSQSSSAFMYSSFGLAGFLGLIGIIPYAQSKNSTLFLVAGGVVGVGLLALFPKYYFARRASSEKERTIIKYNEFIKRGQQQSMADPAALQFAFSYSF